MEDDRGLPLLGAISAFLRWLEELIILISGPMLVVGLGIALVDLLTDGQLLVASPGLLFAWAIAQAIGVDGQLVASWDRAKRAYVQRRWLALLGLITLGCALAYVAYVAGYVFAVQESAGISTTAALHALGWDDRSWLWQRVGVSVFLVCLSGWTRYRAPRQRATLADERERLQEQLELEPLRAELRARRAGGYRTVAAALLNGGENITEISHVTNNQDRSRPDVPEPSGNVTTPSVDAGQPDTPPDPPAPPDGPHTPTGGHSADNQDHSGPDRRGLRSIEGGRRTRRALPASEVKKRGNRTRLVGQRVQAFALLDEDPALSVEALRKALGCRRTTAAQLRQEWEYTRRDRSQA